MTKTLDPFSILSEPAAKISNMHHPWRILRERLPDWTVRQGPLEPGTLGATDANRRVIHLDSRQVQAQKRCTLDHELIHAEDGDIGCQSPQRERAVNAKSSRRLIPLARLLDAVKWAHCMDELAEDLWVDLATVQCRLDNLTDTERLAVRQALAVRDFHEEGWRDPN